jgi:hypothetical protein
MTAQSINPQVHQQLQFLLGQAWLLKLGVLRVVS